VAGVIAVVAVGLASSEGRNRRVGYCHDYSYWKDFMYNMHVRNNIYKIYMTHTFQTVSEHSAVLMLHWEIVR
jgi:hypothetical protein